MTTRESSTIPFRDLRKAGNAEVTERVHELYLSVVPMIHALGKRYFGSGTDLADDLLSEVFARVIVGIRKFEGRSSYATWIFCIALNVAATWRRHKTREAAEPLDPSVQATSDTFASVSDRARAEVVQSAFDKLSAEHRMVLSLAVIDGLSQVDIAGILGIPSGTVYSRYARARIALAKALTVRGVDADS